MGGYIGALDQGTTSTRCLLFDRKGEQVAGRQLEHRQLYPRPGWVEHDPHEIWEKACAVIAGTLAGAKVPARELAAQAADCGGVYFVPAFSGLFAPHWRSDARGVIVGLSRFANKAHLARAALEALWREDRRWTPAMSAAERERRCRLWEMVVQRSLDWVE